MKQFIKKSELSLLNGGYVSNAKGEPVSNDLFIAAQKHAEYVVTFAEKAKSKDFKGKDADSLEDLRREVTELLNGNKTISYVAGPEKPTATLGDKLKKEAMDFINFKVGTERVNKVNAFLNNFNVIFEFEEFGLFFDQDIVKLNKIYTISDIVKATESVIDLL